MKYWYRSKYEQHEIDVADKTEARHWAINNLDQSQEWELSEYKIIFDYDLDDCSYDDDFILYDDFVDTLEGIFVFPVHLEAKRSNWMGQTGYAEANNAEDMISKCMSFNNDYLSLRFDNQDGYYFRTSSHDRPTGFNIYIGDSNGRCNQDT